MLTESDTAPTVGETEPRNTARRGKMQVPVDTTTLRRSLRANKYDGFRVQQPTDTRSYKSKVKPRVVPTAQSSSSTHAIAPALIGPTTAEAIPPPTPIPVIQAVGVQLCAIPEEELTMETLTAPKETGPSSPSS